MLKIILHSFRIPWYLVTPLNHRLIIRRNLSIRCDPYTNAHHKQARANALAHTEGKLSAGINFSSVNNATSLSRATARACRPHPRGMMVKIDV